MKRRAKTSGEAKKEQRRKVANPKRRTAPAAARRKRSVQADLREQLDRSRRELTEAREQQTATSEVLRVISSSPGELERVFEAMLNNATRICGAKFGVLYLHEDGKFRPAAVASPAPEFEAFVTERGAFTPTPDQPLNQLLTTKAVVGETSEGVTDGRSTASFRFGGARTHIAVPMLKEREVVGAIVIFRQEVRPFTEKQIDLLKNFAAQAVIAIENARLLNELRQRTGDLSEALEQQTATADVLKVISSSPGDLKPVFHAMLQNSVKICEAKFGQMFLYEQEAFRLVANLNVPAALAEFSGEPGFLPAEARGPARAHPPRQGGHSRRRCHVVRFFGSARAIGAPKIADRGAAAKEGNLDRRDRNLSPGGSSLYRQAGRVGEEFRRAGRHRHREHAAASRAAPAHRRSHRVAGAADRYLGCAEGYLQFARRP